MAFLMGTDEAGYGPNLGPLTITGTLWQSPSHQDDLYELLDEAVSSSRPADQRLWLADSKVVYGSGRSLEALERTVLACLAWLRGVPWPADAQALIAAVAPPSLHDSFALCPWMPTEPIRLPLVSEPQAIEAAAQRLAEIAQANQVKLVDLACQPILPDQFNQLLDQFGNKAELLSSQTMQLAAGLKRQCTGRLKIVADKHGGRRHYAGLVQNFLTPQLIQVGQESGPRSEYFFREDQREVDLCFAAGGESFLPTALASMVSKYVREVIMEGWNRFWAQHVPGLRPTKGYPTDARRFKQEIDAAQRRLGLEDRILWRRK